MNNIILVSKDKRTIVNNWEYICIADKKIICFVDEKREIILGRYETREETEKEFKDILLSVSDNKRIIYIK